MDEKDVNCIFFNWDVNCIRWWCALAWWTGPVKFVERRYNGTLPQLVYNPNSWTQVRAWDIYTLSTISWCYYSADHLINRDQMASIVFVDSPAGSGFPYARDSRGYDVGDVSSSMQIVAFLRKVLAKQAWCTVWFSRKKLLLKHPFVLTLYSGFMTTPGIFQILSTLVEIHMPGRWFLL